MTFTEQVKLEREIIESHPSYNLDRDDPDSQEGSSSDERKPMSPTGIKSTSGREASKNLGRRKRSDFRKLNDSDSDSEQNRKPRSGDKKKRKPR